MSIKISTSDDFIRIKHKGKIFTPDYLVNIILDQGHYVTGNILKKNIIDNSCGDGQFMTHIVDRYCKEYIKNFNTTDGLKSELETYIFAIDIDIDELEICKRRCSEVAKTYGIYDINWNFDCANTLTVKNYDGIMDFVVGNPPYVRVHNLKESFDTVKNFSFGNVGMTDLFIAFYEIGLQMLNPDGILCYISPSSFFTSLAGMKMREYLVMYKMLESVCDLKHFQPFNAISYTAVVCLQKKVILITLIIANLMLKICYQSLFAI